MGKRDREEKQDKKDKDKDRKHKKHKKEKEKKHKKEKEKRSDKEAQSPPEEQISEEDYFKKSNEFKAWLLESKRTAFETLTSEESHAYFNKFVKYWNRGDLSSMYYTGNLPEDLVASARKTQHKWGFVKKMSTWEKEALTRTADTIRSTTDKGAGKPPGQGKSLGSASAAPAAKKPMVAPRPASETGPGQGRYEGGRLNRREAVGRQKVALEDAGLGKEPGGLTASERRKAVGAIMHGSHQQKEAQMDGLDMSESATFGGGDDFKSRMARAQVAKQRKSNAKAEHLQDLAQREKDKLEAFKKQMGLQAGQGRAQMKPRT